MERSYEEKRKDAVDKMSKTSYFKEVCVKTSILISNRKSHDYLRDIYNLIK